MIHIWKHLIDKYEINELGQLRNSNTGKILKPKVTSKGYFMYGISVEGKYKDVSAHRAVAEAFIPNPENKSQVNHKDGNKQNNAVSNLEWSTPSENALHAFENGLNSQDDKKKSVIQIHNGIVIATYESLTDAAKAIGGNTVGVSRCCTGTRLSYKGFQFSFVD